MEDEIVMYGLGAVEAEDEIGKVIARRPGITPVKAASVAAQNLAQKHIKNSLYTRSQKFLISNAHKLNVDVRNNIKDGRWDEADFYIRRAVSAGSGTQELLKSSNVETVGVCNINSNKLPKGVNASIDKIRVAFAKSATITDPTKASFSNTDTGIDAAIRTGELIIKVGDKPVLKLPLDSFFNIGGSYSAVQGNFDVRTLQRPFLIPEDTSISVAVQLADGSTLATANNFLEIRMMGSSLVTG